MALPIMNELPKYEVTIPSSGKKTRFRPYLVKEEKALMMAFETGDQITGLNGVIDTINACLDDPIDRKKLTSFDVEYLILKIRSKSVGEKIDINVKCKECEHSTSTSVVTDDIKVSESKHDKLITLTDKISLEMKYPSLDIISKFNDKSESQTEDLFKLVALCIDTILTEEERIDVKDNTEEELLDFLGSLTGEQFKKLSDFLSGIPKLSHAIKFKCSKCEKENEIIVEGLASFFT